jgi:hypothetical protein
VTAVKRCARCAELLAEDSTLRRHVGEMKSAGIVKWEPAKRGFADKRRGMQVANLYRVDFTKVISGGGTAFHDFWAPLEDDYAPQTEQEETVTEQQGEQQDEHVSRRSRTSRKDQDPARTREDEPEQKPAAGRGRVPFTYPGFRPSAAEGKNPSVDARLTGSAELDLIRDSFPDSAEQEMASEFVQVLRADYRTGDIIRAAGFWFTENRWALGRVREPRAYARKCAGALRETLDGWKRQEESRRRARESRIREERERAEAERRNLAFHAARGDVRLDGEYRARFGIWEDWAPRDEAVQVQSSSGGPVWVLARDERKYRRSVLGETIELSADELAAIGAGIDLGGDVMARPDTDFSALADGGAPDAGIRRHDESAPGAGSG